MHYEEKQTRSQSALVDIGIFLAADIFTTAFIKTYVGESKLSSSVVLVSSILALFYLITRK